MPVIDADLAARLDTPALLVDLDVLERNITTMAREVSRRGVALRPHFKTHKAPQIAELQRAAGAQGITCATLGEAGVLADAGFDDVFVAFPVWPGGPKRDALRGLHERIGLTIGLDSADAAGELATAMSGAAKPLRVLVEVDTGGSRTGVRPEDAGELAAAAARLGLDVAGVFTHGGHSYGTGDTASRAAEDEVAGLAAAADALRRAGVEPRVVSAGSTPTALLSARDVVTEERPGTYVFQDRQQVAIGSCTPADVALTVASTVVSRSVPGQVVVDAGTKCLGRESQPWLDGYAEFVDWPTFSLQRLYDHHGVAIVPAGADRPPVGSVVGLVPNHVCPVVNLARELVIVRDGAVVDRWPVAARALT